MDAIGTENESMRKQFASFRGLVAASAKSPSFDPRSEIDKRALWVPGEPKMLP